MSNLTLMRLRLVPPVSFGSPFTVHDYPSKMGRRRMSLRFGGTDTQGREILVIAAFVGIRSKRVQENGCAKSAWNPFARNIPLAAAHVAGQSVRSTVGLARRAERFVAARRNMSHVLRAKAQSEPTTL